MNKAVWVKSSVEKSNDCGKTLKYPLMSLMSKKNSNCLLQLFRFAETHGELDDYSIVRRRNEGRPPAVSRFVSRWLYRLHLGSRCTATAWKMVGG